MSKNHNFGIDLFDEVISINNLRNAVKRLSKTNTRYTKEFVEFCLDLEFNLIQLHNELKNEEFKFSNYTIFKVYEPKERIIHNPQLLDKIVQFSIFNILMGLYEKKFIKDSYQCIKDKGHHLCQKQTQKFMNYQIKNWLYPYIGKIDIKRYFYTIDREILKNFIKKDIKDIKLRRLLFKLIDNSLDEKGLPLGNVTSQLFSNIYLNSLDHYQKRILKIQFYVRYMDDIVFIQENKEMQNLYFNKIKEFLNKNLNLEINEKKKVICPVIKGITNVGFIIFPNFILIKNTTKRKIKKKIRKMMGKGVPNCKIYNVFHSYLGHIQHSDSTRFVESIKKEFSDVLKNFNEKDW